MARSKAGGGIKSKQHVSVGVRTGAPAKGRRHEAVSQIGSAIGNKATDSGKIHKGAVERIEGAPRPYSAPLGNEVAKNVGKGGCGTGRVLYGQSGSQQQYGTAASGNPPAKNTDILNQFGPDSAGVRGRR
jgi:hypothetical protein